MKQPEPGWEWRPWVFMADCAAAAPKAAKRVFELPEDAANAEHCPPKPHPENQKWFAMSYF
eukprot:3456713-Rhodomonas_salina.1